jgi:hypothetical protein
MNLATDVAGRISTICRFPTRFATTPTVKLTLIAQSRTGFRHYQCGQFTDRLSKTFEVSGLGRTVCSAVIRSDRAYQ